MKRVLYNPLKIFSGGGGGGQAPSGGGGNFLTGFTQAPVAPPAKAAAQARSENSTTLLTDPELSDSFGAVSAKKKSLLGGVI